MLAWQSTSLLDQHLLISTEAHIKLHEAVPFTVSKNISPEIWKHSGVIGQQQL
jgi:hypothetical protein